MQTTKNTHNTLKKLFGIVTAGAFAIAPLAGVVTPAQSAPILLAQNARDTRTIEGVVVADTAGREFIIRQNNGARIRVRLDGREPKRLSTGDRVRVTGFFRRNQTDVFRADSVQILDNRNTNNTSTFNGRVTDVRSDSSFDMVSNDKTYNVATSSRLPRRLEEGDIVRVYGRRSGDNDITNATVVVTRNTGNNNNNNNGSMRTVTGIVTDINGDRQFDMRVAGTRNTFNVTSAARLPRLEEGDTVRVYGRRSGDNDITNATIVVTHSNNSNNGSMRTVTGIVTDINGDRQFDMRVAGTRNTFNVTSAARLPRLEEGDTVRVYGRRSGDNDITNASVVVTRSNNSNNNNNNNNSLRTYIGRVTDVESDKKFDMVSNGKRYNVSVSSRLSRRLTRGDMVRVYGGRKGDDNITNATVVIVNNR